LGALLARLRRAGVLIALVDGQVKVTGWQQLSPAEREQLRDEKARIVTWLEARELRRQRRDDRKRQQQEAATVQPQQPRRVVGQVVSPGRPLQLLYEDQTVPIPAQRARVLGTIPYGWRK